MGIVLLLAAAAFYTMHMIGIKHWGFDWQDVLVTVPVVNTTLFLPLWFLFPTALFQADIKDIVVQAVYQGILVNIIALMFAAYAIKQLGTITVSVFMSIVPVTTAIMAWFLLNETLNSYELAGIAGCSIGLFLYAKGQLLESKKAHPALKNDHHREAYGDANLYKSFRLPSKLYKIWFHTHY